MKKLIYIIIIFLSFSFLFSCDDLDDDHHPPKIEVISINDILYLDSTFSSGDSLAAGNLNLAIIKFTDNKALSSYNLRLKPGKDFIDPYTPVKPEDGGTDSLAYNGTIKTQKADIFGLDSITIVRNLYISSRFTIYDRETNKNIEYLIRPGKYSLTIDCIDMAGNIDSIQSREVVISYKNANN